MNALEAHFLSNNLADAALPMDRRVVCWVTAIALHSCLVFWKASTLPFLEQPQRGDPIVSVNFELQGAPGMPAAAEEKPAALKSLFNQLVDTLKGNKKSENDNLAAPEELPPALPTTQSAPVMKKLVDKLPVQKKDFDTSNLTGKDTTGLSDSADNAPGPMDAEAPAAPLVNTHKVTGKAYLVGKKDLPFKLSTSQDQGIAGAEEAEIVPTAAKSSPETNQLSAEMGSAPSATNQGRKMKSSRHFNVAQVGESSSGGAGGLAGDNVEEASLSASIAAGISGNSSSSQGGASAANAGVAGGEPTGRAYTGGGGRGFSGVGAGAAAHEEQAVEAAADKKGGRSAFDIEGPLRNRKIIQKVLPVPPQEVLDQGRSVNVAFLFYVLADGTVRMPIIVKRTSGITEWDRTALSALAKWLFVPVDSEEEQWGIITFHIRVQ